VKVYLTSEVLLPAKSLNIRDYMLRVSAEGSFLQRFLAATADLTPEQRGKYLEEPPAGAPDIDEAHQVCEISSKI